MSPFLHFVIIVYVSLAGYKRSAHSMEHSPQKFPRTENQWSSVVAEQSASSFYQNQFNSPPFHAGNYMAARGGGSSPYISSQWIPPLPQQHSSPGPSRLPSQG